MKKEKILEKVTRKLTKARMRLSGLVTLTMLSIPMTANAAWGDGNADAGNVVKSVAEIVVNLFPFIGAFFVISGAFKLIMAYRNDNPEGQAGAAKDIVIGAVFLAFRIFAWNPLSTAIFG